MELLTPPEIVEPSASCTIVFEAPPPIVELSVFVIALPLPPEIVFNKALV